MKRIKLPPKVQWQLRTSLAWILLQPNMKCRNRNCRNRECRNRNLYPQELVTIPPPIQSAGQVYFIVLHPPRGSCSRRGASSLQPPYLGHLGAKTGDNWRVYAFTALSPFHTGPAYSCVVRVPSTPKLSAYSGVLRLRCHEKVAGSA